MPDKVVVTPENALVPADKEQQDGQGTFHFVVVGDGEDSVPRPFTSESLDALKASMHKTLLEIERGWVYVYIDGVRCALSAPTQVFLLKLPDGKTVELRGGEPSFPDDGAFVCLNDKQDA